MGSKDDPQPSPEAARALGNWAWQFATKPLVWISTVALTGISTVWVMLSGMLLGNGECLIVIKEIGNSAQSSDVLIFVEARNTGFITLADPELFLTFTDQTGDERSKEKDQKTTSAPDGVTVIRWMPDGILDWNHSQGETTSLVSIRPTGSLPVGGKFGVIVRISKPKIGTREELVIKDSFLRTANASYKAQEIGHRLSWDIGHASGAITRISIYVAVAIFTMMFGLGINALIQVSSQISGLTKGVKSASDTITANLSDATGKMINATGPDGVRTLLVETVREAVKKATEGDREKKPETPSV